MDSSRASHFTTAWTYTEDTLEAHGKRKTNGLTYVIGPAATLDITI